MESPELYTQIIKIVLLLLPMYLTNSSAMLFGGKTPLDFNKKWRDGLPIFGPGKTWKGSIMGVAIGTTSAFLVYFVFPLTVNEMYANYVVLGFLLALGAIVGDSIASFFKRRNRIKRGDEVLFLDQLDFVIGGMALGSIIYTPNFYEIAAIAILTLLVHKTSNFLAYRMKLKKVPW